MKKFYLLFVMMFSFFTNVMSQDEETVVIYFNQDSGSWTMSNANKSWAAQWTSNATDPSLIITCPNNNMCYSKDGEPQLYTGTVTPKATTWTIETSDGYMITEYEFYAKRISYEKSTFTPAGGEKVIVPTSGEAHVVVKNVNRQFTSFLYETQNDNKGVQLRDFKVTIAKSDSKMIKRVIFVYDKTSEHNVVYRIPSIASIPAGPHKGRVVAITDYRPGGKDVGQAEVDLHAKYSDDYGDTWSDEIEIINGTWGSSKGGRWYSFGDPVSIADRETGRLLMVSCSGDISYPYATRTHHQGVEVYYSEDGGETWSEPVDVSEQLYSALETRNVGDKKPIESLFVGSGGFSQSKFVKRGDYYRVYAGILCRTASTSGINYTIYTDDFGKTWHVLGGADAMSVSSGGDEAKVEELPDGSVLHTSRLTGGRIFNIWKWTDDTFTEGAWDKQANSTSSNKGVVALNNACNGEILIVPAQRVSDGENLYLALQSVPFGSGRTNVGIFWKVLASPEDWSSAATFAANWDGSYQVSYKSSAYSAMVMQEDDNIGFLVEEGTYGCDYSQVYHNLSLRTITYDKYTHVNEKIDGVQTVGAQNETNGIYNIAGQRVSLPRQGLYITGGKKMIVK